METRFDLVTIISATCVAAYLALALAILQSAISVFRAIWFAALR
jgi:hypothetical protein